MELNQEVIEQAGLNEDQVKAVSSYYGNQIAELKNEWDGKANQNAENIIQGAVKYAKEKTGVSIDRNEGEKYGDYLVRLADTYTSGSKAEIDSLKNEYQTKLKEFQGGDALKSELDEVKNKLDAAQQKAAQFDDWEKNDYKGNFEKIQNDYAKLNNKVAFSSVKPMFSDEANPYEVKAKWEEFEKEVNEKYNVQLNENDEAIAIDKENPHKVVKLSKLAEENEGIQSLTKSYTPNGLGANSKGSKIDGLPFALRDGDNVPAVIANYLNSKGLDNTSKEYGEQYAELWAKVREKTPRK